MLSVLFSSDRSSSGKSTVALAFSKKLKQLGYNLNIYKTGPDFIDPFILSKALNARVKNLDSFLMPGRSLKKWMFGPDTNKRNNKTAFIVEGAMGLYDGDSYYIARKFALPVVLVMDSRRISSTMASLIYGIKNYRGSMNVCGVILNNISSQRHYDIISGEIKNNIRGVDVFGYIGKDDNIFSIKERHLGLMTPDPLRRDNEFENITGNIMKAVFKNVNLDMMIKRLEKESIEFNKIASGEKNEKARKPKILKKIKIAVAYDRAFFFYYNFNLDALKNSGAEIVFFSPLSGSRLPEGIKGIYFGGGYPEVYADGLSKNEKMRDEVYKFFKNNGIIYAECGGLMYLCKRLVSGGKAYDFTGVFPFTAAMDDARLTLGYRRVKMTARTFLGEPGTCANGHEFHYSRIIENGKSINAKRAFKYENPAAPGVFLPGGYTSLNAVGSYVHLSFFSNKQVAENIVRSARNL